MTPMPETDTAPARANLVSAIATVKHWEKYIAHCRAVGLANLEVEVNERARPLVAAQDALHELQGDGNAARAALKRGLKGETGLSLEAARRAAEAAEAAEAAYLGACQQRDLAQAEISRLELGDLHRANYAAREALGALLAASPGVIGLLDELHAVWRRQRTIEAALDEIWKIPGALRPHWNARRPQDEVPDPQLAAQWRDVIAKLLTDPASAPLPGVDLKPQPEAAAA
jgi:hypothetical protein